MFTMPSCPSLPRSSLPRPLSWSYIAHKSSRKSCRRSSLSCHSHVVIPLLAYQAPVRTICHTSRVAGLSDSDDAMRRQRQQPATAEAGREAWSQRRRAGWLNHRYATGIKSVWCRPFTSLIGGRELHRPSGQHVRFRSAKIQISKSESKSKWNSPILKAKDRHQRRIRHEKAMFRMRQWQLAEDEARNERAHAAGLVATLPSQQIYACHVSTDAEANEAPLPTVAPATAELEHRLFAKHPLPGDLIGVGGPLGYELAIFVRQIDETFEYYTINACYASSRGAPQKFRLASFVPTEALAPLAPFLPSVFLYNRPRASETGQVAIPQQLCRPMLQKMRDFQQQADRLHLKYAATLDRALDELANEHTHRFLTNDEIIDQLLPDVRSVERHACRWMLSQNFVRRKSGLLQTRTLAGEMSTWLVMPKRQRSYTLAVRESIAEHYRALVQSQLSGSKEEVVQSPRSPKTELGRFAQRMEALVLTARREDCRLLDVTEEPGPFGGNQANRESATEPATFMHPPGANWISRQAFNPADIKFLEVLRDVSHIDLPIGEYRVSDTLAAAMLRATNLYPKPQLSKRAVTCFLQELGVLKPWHSPGYSPMIFTPECYASEELLNLQAEASMQAENWEPVDRHEAFRKDWGDMTAFGIDPIATSLIEGAFSLQRASDDSESYWFHLHVPDVAAHLNASDPIARLARHRACNVYLPETKLNMFPLRAADKLQLQSGSSVLTVSARMNLEGHVLETKVAAARMPTLVKLTPEDIQNWLEPHVRNLPHKEMTVGVDPRGPQKGWSDGTNGSPIMSERIASLSDEDRESLRKSYELLSAYQARCRDRGAIEAPAIVPFPVRVNALPDAEAQLVEARSYPEDPWIRIFVPSCSFQEGKILESISAHQRLQMHTVVSKLASHAAGEWCLSKGLDVPWRVTTVPHAQLLDEFRRRILMPMKQKYGFIPRRLRLAYIKQYWETTVSVSPGHNIKEGAPCSVSITAPLRRYADLLGQWQISSALLQEAGHDAEGVALSRKDLAEETIWYLMRYRIADQATQSVRRSYENRLMHRKFYFNEGEPLPTTFTIYGLIPGKRPDRFWEARVWELTMRCRIVGNPLSEAQGGFAVGQVWRAQLLHVSPYEDVLEFIPESLMYIGDELTD